MQNFFKKIFLNVDLFFKILYNFNYENETLRNINSAAQLSSAQLSSAQLSSAQLSSAQLSITLNFFQVYVYLLIIKYYSVYLLKNYSNSFLNLTNSTRQIYFIYLNFSDLH